MENGLGKAVDTRQPLRAMVPDKASFSLDSVEQPLMNQLVYGLPDCNPAYPIGCAQFIFRRNDLVGPVFHALDFMYDILPDLLIFG